MHQQTLQLQSAVWRCWLTGCMAVVLLAVHDLLRQRQWLSLAVPSRHPVDETLRRLEACARQYGLDVFARLGDPQVSADRRGNGSVLVLGSSADSTPVIQSAPNAPIRLPLTLWIEAVGQGAVVHMVDTGTLDATNAPADTPAELLRASTLLPLVVDSALA